MNSHLPADVWDSESAVDLLIREYDETSMPLPGIDFEPNLLISKVRKHYMDYIIKLLSINYENNQKLLNKNIYLPSAIWRCAKNIEMSAAQACMMVQMYRRNIVAVIKEVKSDTKKGKLNKKLYECLHIPPENEKKLQTNLVMSNDCTCSQRKRRCKLPRSSNNSLNNETLETTFTEDKFNDIKEQSKLPVTLNFESSELNSKVESSLPLKCAQPQVLNLMKETNTFSPKPCVESQDSDELMLQLEKLFQGDPNDDDLFEDVLCDTADCTLADDINKSSSKSIELNNIEKQETVIENHAAQIKSLDERLASLAGLLVNNEANIVEQKKAEPKQKKHSSSKWLCEEYFLKLKLFELLDQIRECNRKKLTRIKSLLLDLFGDDTDDEDVMSPLEETQEFIISCKERVAPWVVKILTPYYIKGRIRGKALFKALAKHLIRLIYQCSQYPSEYEVQSFVSDFLSSHKMIRCEADFKQFRIENL